MSLNGPKAWGKMLDPKELRLTLRLLGMTDAQKAFVDAQLSAALEVIIAYQTDLLNYQHMVDALLEDREDLQKQLAVARGISRN